MAHIIPLVAPRSFVIGNTFEWREQSRDYPPPVWTAIAAFVSPSDQQKVTALDFGDGTHHVLVDDAASANFKAGIYRYQVTATDGSNTRFLMSGAVEAVPNYETTTGGLDDRSADAVIYDAITALMQNKATHDQSSLAIGGRSLSRYTWDELAAARGFHAHAMTDAEKRVRGFASRLPSQVRFIR